MPSSMYAAANSAKRSVLTTGRNKSEQLISIHSVQDGSPPPPANFETGEYLREDFSSAVANWLDFVATAIVAKEQQPPPSTFITSGQPSAPTTHGVLNRCTFALDCDRAMRKVMQVSYFG